jgi:hypothetical protein
MNVVKIVLVSCLSVMIEGSLCAGPGLTDSERRARRFLLLAIHRCNRSSTPAASASTDRIWLA